MFLVAFSAVKAVASQDFNFNHDAYNALCSTDDYDKMVICQNNLLEVADKCYESCHDQYCQLICSESFYESLDGEFILSSFSFRKFYLNNQL